MIVPKDLVSSFRNIGWPPSRIIVMCGECEEELWDSKKASLGRSVVKNSPPYIAGLIFAKISEHQADTGDHDDFDIGVSPISPTREIDATVSINGKEI